MGVRGLPAWIKEASDGIEEDLTKKTCHVDFSAMFFALLNARAFYETVKFEARQARLHYSLKTTSATQMGSPSTKHAHLTLVYPSGTSTSTGPNHPSSVPTKFETTLQHLLQGGPAQIFLDSKGALTTTRVQNQGGVSTLHFQIQLGKDQTAVRNIPNTISLL